VEDSESTQTRRIVRNRKYRVYLNPEQEAKANEWLGFATDLYNACVEQRRTAWNPAYRVWEGDKWVWKGGTSINFPAQSKQITELRQAGFGPDGMPALVQHEVARRVDRTFQGFFRRVKSKTGKAGFPRFKSRHRYDSLTFGLTHGKTSGAGALLKRALRLSGLGDFPIRRARPNGWGKNGKCPSVLVMHRPIPEDAVAKSCILKREGHRWYVCIAIEFEAPVPQIDDSRPKVGVDLRWKDRFAMLSTGEEIKGPNALAGALDKLAHLQRLVERPGGLRETRKVRGNRRGGKLKGAIGAPSQRKRKKQNVRQRERAKLRPPVAKPKRWSSAEKEARRCVRELHAKVARIRKDHLHKVSRDLTTRFSVIAIEKMDISDMVNKSNPAVKESGIPASRRAEWNRGLLDQGGYAFREFLLYKAAEAGTRIQENDPAYKSQDCSGCGQRVPKKIGEKIHRCPHCGLVMDVALNAALNNLAEIQSG
jgi:putative transposase